MIDAPRWQAAVAGLQDSAAALPHGPTLGVDSVVVQSPLPGGIAGVVRFLFDVVPWWIQMAGVFVGAIVGLIVLVLVWRRRKPILAWLAGRRRGVQVALGVAVFALVLGFTKFSAEAWDYTQHDNGFCTGCHVMDPAFSEFVNFKDKHDTLSCHDCHQQPITASLRQLYLWVAERPEEIGEHAGVPNEVCMSCHVVKGDTASWQRIASTAGHRVHLESQDSVLQGVQCITCHGTEVHRFVPAPTTCGQSGCHQPEETEIVLGKMADQTTIHCTACHRFTADVPLLATVDSARGTLVPASGQCLGCHEMQRVLTNFKLELEPHGGTCGTCHNPHKQETPEEALTTCATAGCHDNWETEPFHVGREHRKGAQNCITCHPPHQARVDASDCEACHARVRQGSTLRPPLPFDTLRALRRSSLPAPPAGDSLRRTSSAPPEDRPSGAVFLGGTVGVGAGLHPGIQGPASQDSFPHARHRSLSCIQCHTTRAGHGGLVFEQPRGCDLCHHQDPGTTTCANCHQSAELEPLRTVSLRVTVPKEAPRPRSVGFAHQSHAERRCVECHTTPVTMAASAPARECRSCHEDHHTAGRDCVSCHSGDVISRHDAASAHTRCDACHTKATVALLTPTRSLCANCHQPQRTGHYEPKECTVCHFLSEPGAFRSHLATPSGP
ncbi:MAG: hypothetical protein R2909_21590 [Gemmatimonadales bacterium]